MSSHSSVSFALGYCFWLGHLPAALCTLCSLCLSEGVSGINLAAHLTFHICVPGSAPLHAQPPAVLDHIRVWPCCAHWPSITSPTLLGDAEEMEELHIVGVWREFRLHQASVSQARLLFHRLLKGGSQDIFFVWKWVKPSLIDFTIIGALWVSKNGQEYIILGWLCEFWISQDSILWRTTLGNLFIYQQVARRQSSRPHRVKDRARLRAQVKYV